MDPRFAAATRDELSNVQMEVRQLQMTQHSHAERIQRVEKRLAEDAALKSVWGNSPFPSALSGTPQHGPVHIPTSDVFDDFDEHGQNLLSSLHLEAEDEPVRRGAASRANSVRFDESALQGANWGGQSTRHSGEFAPMRPSSGFGMMERSLSHKSDGRHSSAGHSVHSLHSIASGRGSSLGLDTHFMVGGREDDSPLDMPGPPPGLFVLGSVPAIVRCWLTEKFAHNTLLYADVCSGAQRSTIDYSLVKELDLMNEIQRGADGVSRLRLTVFLAEAIVSQSNSRSPAPAPTIPSMAVSFEIVGADQQETAESRKAIQIFIGTDALRAHSADLLFSQNLMTLYSDDRDKLSVPFVRPEDDSLFRFLATTNVMPEKPKLNASAPEFVLADSKPSSVGAAPSPAPLPDSSSRSSSKAAAKEFKFGGGAESQGSLSPVAFSSDNHQAAAMPPLTSSTHSDSGTESEKPSSRDTVVLPDSAAGSASATGNGNGNGNHKENNNIITVPSSASSSAAATPTTTENVSARRDSSGIWGSWRQGGSANGSDGGASGGPHRSENGLSGYQPAGRSRMKVLKPTKSSASISSGVGAGGAGGSSSNSSSARTGASYDPLPPQRTSGEQHRRKSHGAGGERAVMENGSASAGIMTPTSATSSSNALRWEKRSVSSGVSSISLGPAGTASNKAESKSSGQGLPTSDSRSSSMTSTVPRSTNPVGGASAFSWMTPSSAKPKTPAGVAE